MAQVIKYTRLMFLLLAIMMLPEKTRAAEITAIDFMGNVIGQVISTGMVVSSDGNNVGSITADSLIINAEGVVIGGVVPQGVVIGNDNRFLGKVYSDGMVRSLSGKNVGKTLPNGLVINDSGNVLGAVLYPGLIYSPEGGAIGRFTGGGDYTNLEGQKIGFVSANGYAYRKSGDQYVIDGRLISSKMVVSENGKFLGSIAPTGRIIDFEAKDIGTIKANGFAYNNSGNVIGALITTKYAFDQSGKYLGIVTYNGEVKNGDKSVGYYRPDGNIVNASGEVVGFSISISATANDNKGQYLGYIIPEGLIIRGSEAIGRIGARGYVYNSDGVKIGSINGIGPVYDALANLKGQAMKNGTVISLGGSNIGIMKGEKAFDSNGTMIGGCLDGMIAYAENNGSLGIANINASIKSGAENAKVSPFGYVFNREGKVIGNGRQMGAVYSANGLLYSYISPTGNLYREIPDSKFTGSGILFGKKGYMGEMINPLYALSLTGHQLGRFTQSNVMLNAKGDVAYKFIPAGYVVGTSDVNSTTLNPINGFYSSKQIALNTGGDLIGYADSNGIVVDLNNREYGRVVYDDYVIDNNNVISGKMLSFAPVINEKCTAIGVMNGRGDIVNNRDVIVGRLLPNGQAISDVGSYIGYAVMHKGLVDYDGNFAGTTSYGMAIDVSGKSLGCVDKRGLVEDAERNIRYGVVIPSPVIDFDGKIIGNVMANGEVVNSKDQTIGNVQPDGNVISKTKKNLGNTMRYRIAYDNDNNFLGMVQNNGVVINGSGKNVGQVHFDGSVYNDGVVIGYALYDFYVYDDNYVTYGYLTKDGTVLSMVGSKLGQIDRGFVTDRRRQVVARGNRDYIVRDLSYNVVGYLQLDGTVIDISGKNIGYLSDAGIIRDSDGNEIARATPLQYYIVGEIPDADANGAARRQDWADYRKVQINEIPDQSGKNGSHKSTGSAVNSQNKQQSFGSKVVGIALSPDGDIIGNIYEDDSVKSEDGTQIGFRTPDGIVVDMNYNPIGIEEVKHVSVGEMFIPANAYGNGNAYGIGSQPSNLGPGGGYGQGERYDPVRANALAQLQAARRQDIAVGQVSSNVKVSSFTGYEEEGWPGVNQNISTWRVDMSEMILEDKAIPAVLARSVYAGEGFSANVPITAIVERNVYAEEGRNIIIPAGSRVIGSLGGEGDSGGNSGGAVKIGIAWKRLIRPDGSQFTFNAQTADAQGRAGAIGYLDEQLLKRYSMPMLTSMLESATAYIMASGSGTTNTDTSSTTDARSQAANDARQNFIDQMNQIFEEILQRKANIKSVVYVPAGTRIIIFPNQDLWLNSVEREKRKGSSSTAYEGAVGDRGLTETNPEEGGRGGGNSVTYSGNYQENVRPVSGKQQGGSQGANTGRSNAVYRPPVNNSAQAPVVVPESNVGSDNDVPELL